MMHVVVTEHMKGLYLLLSPQSLFLQHLFSAPGFTFKIFYIKKNDFDPNFFFLCLDIRELVSFPGSHDI